MQDKPCFPGSSSERNVQALVLPGAVRGQYSVQLLQTRAGSSMLTIALAVGGSLTATYYDASTRSSSLNEMWLPIESRQTDLSIGTAETAAFSVRWAGFVRPSVAAAAYTFFAASVAANDERVRLWVDGMLLIDQWQSLTLNLGEQPSATVGFARPHAFYELVVDYRTSETNLATPSRQALTVAHTGGASRALPSSSLFHSEAHISSPSMYFTSSAATDLRTSELVGEAVSISTAGAASTSHIEMCTVTYCIILHYTRLCYTTITYHFVSIVCPP